MKELMPNETNVPWTCYIIFSIENHVFSGLLVLHPLLVGVTPKNAKTGIITVIILSAIILMIVIIVIMIIVNRG